jgi:hypothetical protein
LGLGFRALIVDAPTTTTPALRRLLLFTSLFSLFASLPDEIPLCAMDLGKYSCPAQRPFLPRATSIPARRVARSCPARRPTLPGATPASCPARRRFLPGATSDPARRNVGGLDARHRHFRRDSCPD